MNFQSALSATLALLLCIASPVKADVHIGVTPSDFSTDEAIEVAVNGLPACVDWCVTGVCFYIVIICTPFGCTVEVETTPRISHKYPDVIVTAWTSEDNPYTEAAQIYDVPATTIGGAMMGAISSGFDFLFGGGQGTPKDAVLTTPQAGATAPDTEQAIGGTGDRSEQQRHRNMRFKRTSVIGHPFVAGNQSNSGGNTDGIPGFCPSEAQTMESYYYSDFDALNWRTGTIDLFNLSYAGYAIVPYLAEVGQLWPIMNIYGNRFPRMGFTNQYSDYMSAATVADRSIHIATHEGQSRIYNEIKNDNMREDVEPPAGSITSYQDSDTQTDTQTGPWQMILPVKDTVCYSFGQELDSGRASDLGRYGWNYWQRYSCCLNPPPNGIYVGSAEADEPVCLELDS